MIQHNYYYVELNFRSKRVVFSHLKNFSLTIFRRVPKREKGLQQTLDAIFIKEKIKKSHRHDAIVIYLTMNIFANDDEFTKAVAN